MFLNFGILCLNEVRKNRAANLERSPLMLSYAGTRTSRQDFQRGNRRAQQAKINRRR
jgi:hypothetical protein